MDSKRVHFPYNGVWVTARPRERETSVLKVITSRLDIVPNFSIVKLNKHESSYANILFFSICYPPFTFATLPKRREDEEPSTLEKNFICAQCIPQF